MIEYTWNKSDATLDINGNVISLEFMLVGTEDGYAHSYSIEFANLPEETFDGMIIHEALNIDKKLLSEYTADEVRTLAESVEVRFGWKEGIRTKIKSDRNAITKHTIEI